ncbi:MAG: CBS domain-containing protein [Cyanobacteria bacterium P01_F01_bin.42]
MHPSLELVLCHRTADFDALGAAVGLARLNPGTRIVLCGGAHPTVKNFLALYRNEFPLVERRAVDIDQVRRITVVDAQRKDRLGLAAEWLEADHVTVEIWDHHLSQESDIEASQVFLDRVGAATTLMVEQCQQHEPQLSIADLTVMALGIHVDTGSLTYEGSTSRDAQALAWLMAQGANQRAIAEYTEPGFSEELQTLLGDILQELNTDTINGYRLAWGTVKTPAYVPGLSSLASQLLVLSESDAFLLGHIYRAKAGPSRLTVIGRSRIEQLDLAQILGQRGGGGHRQAAALTVRAEEPDALMAEIVEELKQALPLPPTARDLMSAPVRTIRPDSTIDQARRILLRYGHSGLSVVDRSDRLVGIISRRDLDIALHHGFGHAPVKGYMTSPVQTVTPNATLPDIEALMVRHDIGRLPVVQNDQLLGIVTRTDILRQLHQLKPRSDRDSTDSIARSVQSRLRQAVPEMLYRLLTVAAQEAEKRQWQLYLVGGAVRDFLLGARGKTPVFKEFDLVVDGVLDAQTESVGGALALGVQQHYPDAQIQIYGQFQTASLIWHQESDLGPFSMDIATARSEFYPYPAANPEVSISSIRQDLYRRDFTINALAIRLTARSQTMQSEEELLDFFGGIDDLKQKQIKVLHPNSFIEDPTRIFRAIRFASRLGFELGEQTQSYLQHAIASGIYHASSPRTDRPALQSRLRNELKYIFQESHWRSALDLMETTDALSCLHPNLHLTEQVKEEIAIAVRWQAELEPEPERWLIVVQILLTQLDAAVRQQLAAQLNLPEKVQQRLEAFDATLEICASQLNQTLKPSQVVRALKGVDDAQIIICAARGTDQCRQNLWSYLNTWKSTPPLLNGQTLIELGYRPGKSFRGILDFVLDATLDELCTSREDAIALVKQAFPPDHA